MKPRKIDSSDVIGYLVSPQGEILADGQGSLVVCTAEARRYLLTAKKRDTNLLAGG